MEGELQRVVNFGRRDGWPKRFGALIVGDNKNVFWMMILRIDDSIDERVLFLLVSHNVLFEEKTLT